MTKNKMGDNMGNVGEKETLTIEDFLRQEVDLLSKYLEKEYPNLYDDNGTLTSKCDEKWI